MASIAEKLAAAAKEAVARLFVRSKLRLGVIQPPKGDKRLYVSTSPEYSLPGLYETASREWGTVARRSSIEEVRRSAAGFLESQAEAAKAAAGRMIHHLVKGVEGRIDQKTKGEIRDALDNLFEKLTAAVERIADSEATAVRNLAGLDAAAAMGKSVGDDDPTVFFVVTRISTCSECYKVHCLPNKITPRVWKLSEVSSAYHVRGEDRPSTFGLHPKCQCSLAYLSKGYGFDSSGNVKFISLDHDEYAKQRSGKEM